MRYFKNTSDDYYSIWQLREDGMEKCILDNSNNEMFYLCYEWHNPKSIRNYTCMLTLIDCVNKNPDIWVEITEGEAFLEVL